MTTRKIPTCRPDASSSPASLRANADFADDYQAAGFDEASLSRDPSALLATLLHVAEARCLRVAEEVQI